MTRCVLLVAALGLNAALGASGLAAELYVSATGNDAHPGTREQPWRTLQKAANLAQPGDTVYARGGIYVERVKVNVSGTAAAPIVFANYPGERPILDLNGVAPSAANHAIIRIAGRSHVTIRGFELCNLRTTAQSVVPTGIHIEGASQGVRIEGNHIHHIEQNNAVKWNHDANGHGIAVYGNAATPIEGLVIDGNEVAFLRLGASEAIVVNGNVAGFRVTNNHVHDCNNIGIDAIGYEGTAPPSALDRARDGVIAENTIHRIDTTRNPAYGGSFGAGGGDKAAAGIYVDGGTRIVVERNHVFDCNYGVEIASEHRTGRTDFVTVRSNLIRHCHMAGVIMGGYDHRRGVTENCTVANNTLYENDTATGWAGQINFQFYVRNSSIVNNVVWATARTRAVFVHYPGGSGATAAQKEFGAGNVFSHNLYFTTTGSAANLVFEAYTGGKQRSYAGLAAWQASGLVAGDARSCFGNPQFVGAAPGVTAALEEFGLGAMSPALDAASPVQGPAVVGEWDLLGGARWKGAWVDRGAIER